MLKKTETQVIVTVAGHPFEPIGMGTHIRSVHRSLQAARVPSALLDIFGTATSQNRSDYAEFSPFGAAGFETPVNIFCLNGDEIIPALRHRGIKDLASVAGFNIAYPMWELPYYPAKWSKLLARFDEVWAPSLFIEDALRRELGDKVRHMPISCEVRRQSRRSRRSFNIPDDPFVFLTSFAFSSYMERKNPFAAVEAFYRMRDKVDEDVALVIKLQHGESRPDEHREFRKRISSISESVTLIDETLTADDMHSLISLCDAYLSLHRSEGFGLGMAEAMCLGRPSVSTAWSGNMDFCNARSTQLVDYKLIDVRPGQYPFWQNQVWAEADVDDAAGKMAELVSDRRLYRSMSFEGGVKMRTEFSHLAAGLRYAERIREITAITKETKSLRSNESDDESRSLSIA